MGGDELGADALRDALAGDHVTVTVVPIIRSPGLRSGREDDIVKIGAVRIVTYR